MYTYFDKTKKVLCVIQIIEDIKGSKMDARTVMGHLKGEDDELDNDSVVDYKPSADTHLKKIL